MPMRHRCRCSNLAWAARIEHIYGATAAVNTTIWRLWSTTSPTVAAACMPVSSWARSGKLVCDDYSGYKALFERGVIEIGCMAHARRKFHDLYANHRSDIATEALRLFAELYEIERIARAQKRDADGRQQLRRQRAKPLAETLRQ